MTLLDKKQNFLEESFNALPKEIGSLIDITPEVWEILGSLYKTEAIYAKNVEIIGEGIYQIHFQFPEYELTTNKINHVSNVQIQAAINQALYIGIGLVIRQSGVDTPIDYKTFLLNRENVIYRRDSKTYRKLITPGEKVSLTLQINPVVKKGDLYSISADFLKKNNAFLDGQVECLLEKKYI